MSQATEPKPVAPPSVDEINRAVDDGKGVVADFRDLLLRAANDAHARGQDEWPYMTDELDKWVDLLDSKGDALLDEARIQLHLGMMEVSDRARAMQDIFAGALKDAREKRSKVKTSLESAQLQAHLAKLDASEAIEARRTEFEKRLHQTQRDGLHPVLAAQKEVIHLVKKWAELYN